MSLSSLLPQTLFSSVQMPVDAIPRRKTAPEPRSIPLCPPMRLTERDRRILEAIHAYDGMLSAGQIKRLFFTGDSQMQLRLRLLYRHGYLARPDRRQRASLDEPVFWLAPKGAEFVAGLSGTPAADFTFRREPRWMQVAHDVAVNEVRITLSEACKREPGFELEAWIPQSEFWAHPDRVDYTLPNGTQARRFIRPDGYAIVRKGAYVCRLLLELDRATEHNPRFAAEKILPGIAYVRSEIYKRRFGYNSGKWLIVTTGERRLQNMKRSAELVAEANARLFYFTTLDRVTPGSLLTQPVWQRGGADVPVALF